MQPAIKIENISKRYQIGKRLNGNQSFQEQLKDLVVGPFQRLGRALKGEHLVRTEDFWALKDVSFEVQPGEVVGIIGRNGAGKSTLLKILSRITEPTTGQITINGRVASLLEVGTGFHPELTGRENVYLNGSILGMKKSEIDAKFDEIVEFSGIEKFLDTPVKRYSSGMYVRLAFSVAAHLDPEILIVDEVLAVGDDGFQKKCLGKMESVSRQGRTVLFVSHNLPTVSRLCSRGLLLDKGEVVADTDAEAAVEYYVRQREGVTGIPLRERTDRIGDGRFRFVDAWLEDGSGRRCDAVIAGSKVAFILEYEMTVGTSVRTMQEVAISILTRNGARLIDLGSQYSGHTVHVGDAKQGRLRCVIERFPFNVGEYTYHVWAKSPFGCEDFVFEAGRFSVSAGDYFGTGRMPEPEWVFLVDHVWVSDPLQS